MEFSLSCTEWFLTLYSSPFEKEFTAVVWDFLFVVGDEVVFMSLIYKSI